MWDCQGRLSHLHNVCRTMTMGFSSLLMLLRDFRSFHRMLHDPGKKSVSFSLIPLQIGLFKIVFLEIDITDRWGICITSISMHPHGSCQTGISPSAEWDHSSQVSSHWIFKRTHWIKRGSWNASSYQKLLFRTVQVKQPTLLSEHAEEFVCDLIKGW